MSAYRPAASLQPLMPVIVAVLAVTVAAMWWGAHGGQPAISALAAGAFVAATIGAAWSVNRPVWQAVAAGSAGPDEQRAAARRNARLVMLVYGWGAAALFAVYALTAVKWQHGKQYAVGMALISLVLLVYVRRLEAGSALAAPGALNLAGAINAAHGIAAAGGLAFLVTSGKLWAGKGDWAANHVFLAGGVAIVAISAMAALTHRRLTKPVA